MKMVHPVFRTAATCEIALTVCHSMWPQLALPFGGSELGQLGLVFATAFITVETVDVWHVATRSRRKNNRRSRTATVNGP